MQVVTIMCACKKEVISVEACVVEAMGVRWCLEMARDLNWDDVLIRFDALQSWIASFQTTVMD